MIETDEIKANNSPENAQNEPDSPVNQPDEQKDGSGLEAPEMAQNEPEEAEKPEPAEDAAEQLNSLEADLKEREASVQKGMEEAEKLKDEAQKQLLKARQVEFRTDCQREIREHFKTDIDPEILNFFDLEKYRKAELSDHQKRLPNARENLLINDLERLMSLTAEFLTASEIARDTVDVRNVLFLMEEEAEKRKRAKEEALKTKDNDPFKHPAKHKPRDLNKGIFTIFNR